MKLQVLASVCILGILSSCSPDPKPGGEQHSDQADTSGAMTGARLARMYCTACHTFPEPKQLDKASWRDHVLPRMGYFMGVYPDDSTRAALIETGPGGVAVERANIFPKRPTIDSLSWSKILAYYVREAPAKPLPVPAKSIATGLQHFRVSIPDFKLSPPSTTMVRFSDEGFYLGDAHTKTLYHFDDASRLRKAAALQEGPVWLRETARQLLVTVMGSFAPTDAPTGFIATFTKASARPPALLLQNLKRPVHSAYADLNNDGLDDIVTCEFGKWLGSLSWWEHKGQLQFERHILRNKPGAIRAYIRDLNADNLPDIIALFGQADEGIFAYFNQGHGQFREKRLLQFDPSYGSSFFDLFDFNSDGHLDIIYTCGDNADFRPIMKYYHGIRIYLNDGENNFNERFFYQLNGAYNAIPRDFDLDGDIDIAAISFFPDWDHTPEESFVYLENHGDWKFSASTFAEVNVGRWIVMDAGDLNKDGDDDLVLGSLAFEVVAEGNWVQSWVDRGIPFVVLENTSR